MTLRPSSSSFSAWRSNLVGLHDGLHEGRTEAEEQSSGGLSGEGEGLVVLEEGTGSRRSNAR